MATFEFSDKFSEWSNNKRNKFEDSLTPNQKTEIAQIVANEMQPLLRSAANEMPKILEALSAKATVKATAEMEKELSTQIFILLQAVSGSELLTKLTEMNSNIIPGDFATWALIGMIESLSKSADESRVAAQNFQLTDSSMNTPEPF